jgi:hypothetical protein
MAEAGSLFRPKEWHPKVPLQRGGKFNPSTSRRLSWLYVVSTYIKKEHAGAPFAPALLSSLLYLVGADVTGLVVVVMCFVVARWKEVTLT